MHPTIEKRWALLLFFLTEMLLYAFGLRMAALFVVDTLPGISWAALERDRFVCMGAYAAAAFLLGAYDTRRLTDRFDTAYLALGALSLALLAQLACATLLPAGLRVLSRREMLAGAAVTALLLLAWRLGAAELTGRFRAFHRRFHVLGGPEEGPRIAAAINAARAHHAEAAPTTLDALRARCAHDAGLRPYHRVPEDVIIETGARTPEGLTGMLSFCEEHFERVYLYPSFDDLLLCSHDALHAIGGVPLIEVTRVQRTAPYLHVKRVIDIAAALAGLILASPLCAVAAVLAKRSSPGPVFYLQERLGREGRPFKIIKFRSMRVNGGPAANEHVLAREDDPRITPAGRFLRRHRIDEIPQLINVLKGDMSLVGPRPVWRAYYEEHEAALPHIALRLLVRPGITSLSHVLGGYETDPRDRLRYDLVYINTVSLLTDLKILFATVRIVLSGKGAR